MVVVTADHSTPVLYGDHTCEPVPFAAAHLARFAPQAPLWADRACLLKLPAARMER